MCDRINHLSNYQRHICLTRPHVFQMLINGLITGHKGCTEALSDQVWNCSQSLMTRSSYINYGVKEGGEQN